MQIATSVGEDVEKLEPVYVTNENIKWYRYFGKVWQFLRSVNIVLK
jgi:hypothetical protein